MVHGLQQTAGTSTHPLTAYGCFLPTGNLEEFKKKGYAPTKHKMYTVLSITRKGMLILGLTDVRDSKQLNTKVKNRKKQRVWSTSNKDVSYLGIEGISMSSHPRM